MPDKTTPKPPARPVKSYPNPPVVGKLGHNVSGKPRPRPGQGKR
jgi:hypothetical protein